MPLPDRARARKDGDVWDAFNALEEYVDETDVIEIPPGADYIISQEGTQIFFVDDNPWNHPFEIGASSTRVSVSPGLFADQVPTIELEDGETFRRIDGLNEEGRFIGFPSLTVQGPEGAAVTFVCARVLVDRTTGELLRDDADKIRDDAVTIVHREERPQRTADGGSEAELEDDGTTVGYDVLGRLTWTAAGRLVKIDQVALWHRDFAFKRGGESEPDRFFPFSP